MRRIKKSTGLTEKWVTVVASYVIVLVLWLVLRKKEALQRKYREENEEYTNTKNSK